VQRVALLRRRSETAERAYEQNAGLDSNKDGKVTKQEAAAKVKAKLAKGLLPENSG